MDFDFIIDNLPFFLKATKLTLILSIWSIVLSLCVGFLCSIVLYYNVRGLKFIVKAYIELSRNTPALIQLFFLYYGLTQVGWKLEAEPCAVIALTFLGGSYMAEAFRSGLESVGKTQIESGLSIGLSGAQLIRYVVFPQAFSVAMPALEANAIFLIKETSIVSAVALPDLMFVAKDLIGMYYSTVESLLMLVLFYLVILLPLSLILSALERKCAMVHSGIQVILNGANLLRLLGGLLVTLEIALTSVAASGILGILFGIVMTSKSKILRTVCRVYLEAIRIIPILVWLLIFYFGLSRVLYVNLDGKFISVLVFTLWGTAEMGDIVRGAVQSLPKHQMESGAALGLTTAQNYRYIIIPQVVQRLLPAAINLATRMIKTTSLVVLIGVVEVLKVGQQIIEVSILTAPTASFWVYGLIFFLYFIICYPVSLLSKRLERKWQA